MKHPRISATVLFLFILAVTACRAPGSIASGSGAGTSTPGVPATETLSPSATATPQPSLTPTAALLQLEVVEWAKWEDVPGYANVEVLLRNPNNVPVKINRTEASMVNSAGEIVLTTEDVEYYLWADQGWGLILPGETVPATIHAYPANTGEVVPEWKTFRLDFDLEEANPIPYSLDIKVSLGKFGTALDYDYGAPLDITNTSGQTLTRVLFLFTARDTNGTYLGVDNYVTFGKWDDAGNPISRMEPGQTSHTIFVPILDRVPLPSIHYKITAIGLLAQE